MWVSRKFSKVQYLPQKPPEIATSYPVPHLRNPNPSPAHHLQDVLPVKSPVNPSNQSRFKRICRFCGTFTTVRHGRLRWSGCWIRATAHLILAARNKRRALSAAAVRMPPCRIDGTHPLTRDVIFLLFSRFASSRPWLCHCWGTSVLPKTRWGPRGATPFGALARTRSRLSGIFSRNNFRGKCRRISLKHDHGFDEKLNAFKS